MSGDQNRSRHALLIGINKFANLSERAQLQGCVNDARLMRSVLVEQFGFEDGDIRLISDEQATREGILAELRGLTERVQHDDIVVVYYAGHGSQITDLEGDELDGLDSTLVPHDAVRPPRDMENPPPNVDITDDEIDVWLREICGKTANVSLIFDCCHSGTITRDDLGLKTRQIEADTRPPAEIGRLPGNLATRSASAPEGGSGWLPIGDRYVLIAGCRDSQTAKEYKPSGTDERQGAMTYFLCEELRRTSPGSTYRDVFEKAAARIIARVPDQHPQLEGARDREIFGIHDIRPMQYLLVSERSGNHVEIAGGTMQFVLPNSEWTVLSPGARSAVDNALGRIRINEVGASKSKGSVIQETEKDTIVSGCRAVPSDGAQGIEPLRIVVPEKAGFEEAVTALRTEIEQSKLLQLVEKEDGFDLCIFAIEPRTDDGEPQSPVSHLRKLEAASWVAVGPYGKVSLPIHPIASEHVEERMRLNAEKVARHRRLLDLSPGLDDPLKGTIEALLLRRDPAGVWHEASPDPSDGMVTFVDGDQIGLRVTNRHDEPLYIHVIGLTMVFEIDPWFPDRAGAQEALAPGRTVDVLVGSGDKWRIDKGFPFAPDPADPKGMSGPEVVKVIASTEPADLTVLAQEGVRSAAGLDPERSPGRSSALFNLLAETGQGVRGRETAKPTDVWTSLNLPVRIDPAPSSRRIDPDGVTDLGPVVIRSSGISGDVELLPTLRERTRSVEAKTNLLEDGLSRQSVYPQHIVRVSNAVAERGLEESSIEIDARDPGEARGQFVLYADEAGAVSWHFAQPSAATRSTDGRSGTRTYRIDRNAEGETEGKTRGLIGAAGMKLIEVLVFPMIDPVLGAVGDYFAGKWEAKNRAYGLRTFTAENRSDHDGDPVSDWSSFAKGKALLLVHGTFSRANAAFAGLSDDTVRSLHELYEGRVFAFDHPSLSEDPKGNVEWFLNQLPDDARLDVDIVCHSRGGLVSRVLAEKQSEFSLGSKSLNVGKVVFVGSPNAGTRLANAEKMGEFINSFTNLLNFLPDNPATAVLDALITVVKLLSVGVTKGLEGLQCMEPGGAFQKWINAGGGIDGVEYFALASDYEPRDKGLKEYGKSLLMRKIFDGDNDLVVPTGGVFEENGSGLFPIENRYVFGPTDGISHVDFFSDAKAQEKILGWLG